VEISKRHIDDGTPPRAKTMSGGSPSNRRRRRFRRVWGSDRESGGTTGLVYCSEHRLHLNG